MSIKTAYNSWASQYDSNQNKTRDLDAKSTKETLSDYDFKKVLELGCGTGKNTEWLLTKADFILGMDFSQEMLTIAENKIKNENVQFLKADLNEAWNVENYQFDLITSSLTLEHIQNLNHIFQEANQKLLQSGLFFISELHPYKQYLGSGAKYETQNGVVRLEVYTHHISDFIENAHLNGFELVALKEWFDHPIESITPRLISFVFRKK